MSVYVDPLLNHGGSATFKWTHSCHMYADTIDELHDMARRIGMKRAWFQNKPHLPHYDLNASRRAAAVRSGAIETTIRDLGQFMACRRARLAASTGHAEGQSLACGNVKVLPQVGHNG